MTFQHFLKDVLTIAAKHGHLIEESQRNKLPQINFGNKKLHAGHLENMYPEILKPHANIAALIERVAPGRPCTHKPMKEIVAELNHPALQ